MYNFWPGNHHPKYTPKGSEFKKRLFPRKNCHNPNIYQYLGEWILLQTKHEWTLRIIMIRWKKWSHRREHIHENRDKLYSKNIFKAKAWSIKTDGTLFERGKESTKELRTWCLPLNLSVQAGYHYSLHHMQI